MPPARKLRHARHQRLMLQGLHCDAGDKDEVPDTSSRHASLGTSPNQPGASTGAAQAVRELKAENRRRRMPTKHQQPVSDAAQMEAAAGQDTDLPAGEAETLQVCPITDPCWLIHITSAPSVLGTMLRAAAHAAPRSPCYMHIWHRLEREAVSTCRCRAAALTCAADTVLLCNMPSDQKALPRRIDVSLAGSPAYG